MAQILLLLAVALTVGAVVFGVMVLVSGTDPGMRAVEPDGRSVPLPGSRPLVESDISQVTFDVARGFPAARGYRMAQVDQALKRVAYDIGYKDELIGVLTAEVEALREGRVEDADALRSARLAALGDATEALTGSEFGAEQPATVEAADESEPVELRPATDSDAPDGPFAPWPVKAAAEAVEEVEVKADEVDHPTDMTGGDAAEPAIDRADDSPAQKAGTRG